MSHPPTECLEVEERLSALLDGELSPAQAAEAFEHAFGCASCRAFFLAAKRLQSLAPDLAPERPLAPPIELAPESAVAAGAAATALARVRPFLRAAALVAIGLGGGWMLSRLPGSPVPGVATAMAAPMTEQRFVALASELMAADTKYQRTMLEVLRLVPALETGEGLGNSEEPKYVRTQTIEPRAGRGAV